MKQHSAYFRNPIRKEILMHLMNLENYMKAAGERKRMLIWRTKASGSHSLVF